ncbi:hypothetical protein BSF38_03397 [Paludisphaera borealis]|uniref:DUF1501 domain-containing protein n=1 Tax=Paludisphaera borealis TaxID=1387353 RepID=A0A1U7CSE9_9BACT|nr:hypothetical protein BSF38_03397 [Paludisphaera borealis]
MSEKRLFPCGNSRREFLWEMGGGFAGTALAGMLGLDGFFNRPASAAEPVANAMAARPGHFPSKAKNVIFLMMNGGPSQVDTFDHKPALEKYAGKPLPADKKFINSGGRKMGFLTPAFRKFRPGGQSGLLVSDYFPRVREHADELAVIRSCHTDSHAHGSALVAMNTGKTFIGRPSLGSWAVYGLGNENQNLPGYVVILDKRGGPISGQPNWSSGFMPAGFQGTLFRPTGTPILDLQGPSHLGGKPQREQLDLLAQLNQEHLDARPGWHDLAARAASYELAYRMQAEAPEAVDLSKETEETKTLYGVGRQPTDEFGRNCLVARRLVERGVRFVQLYSGGGHLDDTWDAHNNIEDNHSRHAAEIDQPISALLTDLKRRGLLDSTLVVWGGSSAGCRSARGRGRRGGTTTPTASRCGWPAAASRGGSRTARPTTSASKPWSTRSTSPTSTPPSSISWA